MWRGLTRGMKDSGLDGKIWGEAIRWKEKCVGVSSLIAYGNYPQKNPVTKQNYMLSFFQ